VKSVEFVGQRRPGAVEHQRRRKGLRFVASGWPRFGMRHDENRIARTAVTSIIAVAVWWGFLTGHIINSIRGFGS
jgi:hypothetical protein